MTRKQRIFVLYTGGTIGMSQSSQGLRPDVALAGKALQPFSDGLQRVVNGFAFIADDFQQSANLNCLSHPQ